MDNAEQSKFHIDEDPGFAHDGRDLSRYRCESQAYQRLQAHGVCSQGRVPKFYGTIEDLDPGLFGSQLAAFENDKQKPSAILLEYLPEAEPLTKNNIREGFVQLGLDGLEKIHAAGVIHNDPYPDNVVVSEDRLVWIDFDTAIVFPEGRKKRGKLRLKVEVEEESACFESAANNIVRSPFTYFGWLLTDPLVGSI